MVIDSNAATNVFMNQRTIPKEGIFLFAPHGVFIPATEKKGSGVQGVNPCKKKIFKP